LDGKMIFTHNLHKNSFTLERPSNPPKKVDQQEHNCHR